MANEVKDNLVELEVVYSKLNKAIDENIARLNVGATAVDNYNKKISVVPSEFQKSLVDIKTKTDAVTLSAKKLEQQSIKESNARNALNKQREQAIAQLEKENAKLQASENLYNKVQSKLNALSNEYKNLATRKELGLTLTAKEEQRYNSLQTRIQNYDKTLKAVDGTMGKYQRNVGNYASAFNPLQNSINQLGREMPAFANSVQTGFMAISNNLPIFFDAMGQVIAQNKQLQAEGKPTQSVLKQLASSLFSFQTLLSVGVTLLTVYGKEIGNWVSELWGASDALNELNKNQKEFNASKLQGKKESVSDISQLNQYKATMRNSNLPLEERMIALEKLRSMYPFYFKNLKDEALLNGDISKQLRLLNSDLEKKSILEKANEANVKNSQKLIGLKEENKYYTDIIPSLRERVKVNRELASSDPRQFSGLLAVSISELEKAEKKRLTTGNDILKYEEAIKSNTQIINKYKTDTIRLEYSEKEQRDVKIKQLREIRDLEIDQADFQTSDFNYQKTILENLISNNKKIADNESLTLNERLLAYSRYSEFKKQLVLLEYNQQTKIIDKELKEQKESINQAYNEQIKEINNALAEKTTTTAIAGEKRAQAVKEKEEAIQALEKKIYIDRNLSYEQFVQKQKDLTDEWNQNVPQKITDALKRLKANNTFSEEELQATKDLLKTLKEVSISSDFSAIEQNNSDKMTKIRLDRLNSERNYYAQKLVGLDKDSEDYQNYASKIIAIDKQITDEQLKQQNKRNENLIKNQEYLKTFIDDFASSSGFSKIFDLIDRFDQLKENGVATALAISEAFQEAFNTIASSSQANFDAEYSRLEMQKELSLKFAGESATAKEEIERQAEVKRKEIQRREAEAQKRLAIFNIAVNTAQAIVAAVAKSPLTGGLPFSAIAAAIGAAQIALVQSQEIPQFWKGTDNAPEGLAWTQEKGAEIITDKYGKVKSYGSDKGPQLTYLSKGDKVYTAQKSEEYINKELAKNGIMPMRQSIINYSENKSLSKDDFNNGISKLAKTFKSQQPTTNTQVFLNNKQINTDYFKGKKV